MKPLEETEQGLTPLYLAAAAIWPEGVQILIDAGADKYAQDRRFRFPVDFALSSGCVESVEPLMDGDCTLYFTKPSANLRLWPFLETLLQNMA
jgi:hypothetical protein